jgi:hypothetical protein
MFPGDSAPPEVGKRHRESFTPEGVSYRCNPWASIKASATFKTKAWTRPRLAIAASIMVCWRTASEGGPCKGKPKRKASP